MDLETSVKTIRKLYAIITGKSDSDVTITYKGTEAGVTMPWVVRIDSRETKSANHMDAVTELLNQLRKELTEKISFSERQVADYKKALKTLDN